MYMYISLFILNRIYNILYMMYRECSKKNYLNNRKDRLIIFHPTTEWKNGQTCLVITEKKSQTNMRL